MREICIQPEILKAMRLSVQEVAVLNILMTSKNLRGLYASRVAKNVNISNKIVRRILVDLEKCGVVIKVSTGDNVRPRWKYKKGLDRFETRRGRRLRFSKQIAMCAEEEFDSNEMPSKI